MSKSRQDAHQPASMKTPRPLFSQIDQAAQQSLAASGLSGSDRTITTVDAEVVARAAVQGLNQKVDQREAALREELKRPSP